MADYQRPLLVYDRIDANKRRTWLLLGLFALAALPSVVFFGQYLMVWAALPVGLVIAALAGSESNLTTFLVADAAVVFVSMALGLVLVYRYAAARVIRTTGARPLPPGEERQLEQVVDNIAIASGLPAPALFVIEQPALNLLAVGVAPRSSALLVTRGMLQSLDRRELEGAVAHAMAQIGNYDTRLDTVLAATTTWLRLPRTFAGIVLRGLARLASRFGTVGWGCLAALGLWLGVPMLLAIVWGLTDSDIRPFALAALAIDWYVFFGAPLAALLIARLVSRGRKHLADADATLLTKFPAGLARALAKAGEAGSAYVGARGETSNLHFADPLRPDAGRLDRAFDTHPTIAERLDAVMRLGGTVAPEEIEQAVAAVKSQVLVAAPSEAPAWLASPATASSLSAPAPPVQAVELLNNGTELRSGPHQDAPLLGVLPTGTRLMILSEHEGFFEVITPDDRVGFVAMSVRLAPLNLGRILRRGPDTATGEPR